MASTSKAFKKCVDPCPRYLTPDDTHNLCVFCLGKEHARDVLEGKICMYCEPFFSMKKKLSSRLSLFSRKEGQPSASCDSGPKAHRRMKSWGSKLDLADELERDRPFSRASAENECELLDCDDAIFLTSSGSAASALLGYAQEEQEMFGGEEVETEPSQSSCTAYDELLEVMDHKIIFLSIKPPARGSLPFFLNLHVGVEKEWKKQFFSRIHRFQHTSYADIEGMHENGYEGMPPCKRR